MEWITQFLQSTEFTNIVALFFGGGTVFGLVTTYLKTRELVKLRNENLEAKESKEETKQLRNEIQELSSLVVSIADAFTDTNIPNRAKRRLQQEVNGVVERSKHLKEKVTEDLREYKEIAKEVVVEKVEEAQKIIERFTRT